VTDLSKNLKATVSSGHQALDPLLLWYDIVIDFTMRQLSFKSDKFPAISGLAREVHRNLRQQYKASLWLNDMHIGLLWSSYKPYATKTTKYIAPN
jgi:hypothetical protein